MDRSEHRNVKNPASLYDEKPKANKPLDLPESLSDQASFLVPGEFFYKNKQPVRIGPVSPLATQRPWMALQAILATILKRWIIAFQGRYLIVFRLC